MSSVTCLISGETKTGKTTLGLTFPKPLRHFDLDVGGFRRAKHRFQADIDSGQVVSKSYFAPQQAVIGRLDVGPSKLLVGMKELWYKMLKDYLEALKDEDVATIMFDSWAQVWELCRSAFLQEKQEFKKERSNLMREEYTEPNARMRAILTAAVEMDKNLVLTAPMDDEYEKRQGASGEVLDVVIGRKSAGWRHIDPLSDVNIRNDVRSVSVVDDTGKSAKVLKVYSKFTLCGLALQATGFEMPDATWDSLRNVIVIFRGSEI